MTSRLALPEKRWVGHSFSRAAARYDGVAALQRYVGGALLSESSSGAAPMDIVDVGAGTGYCTARLRDRYPHARLIALDIAHGMLDRAMQRPELAGSCWPLCADAEFLPLRTSSVDLLFSNLAIQWCPDVPAVLAEFRRVLRPSGRVQFSSFNDDTLQELRTAWAAVDAYSHVNAFLAHSDVERMLADAGFRDVRVQSSTVVLEYPAIEDLMRELKHLGAHNITTNRPPHLTGKQKFKKMMANYQDLMEDDRIRASFGVLTAHARPG